MSSREPAFLDRWRWWLPALVGTVIVASADQTTKLLILATRPDVTLIPGFFSLTFGTNPGAAFGLFRSFPVVVTLLGIAVLLAILIYLGRGAHVMTGLERVALTLVAGGASGNTIDRLRLGYVVDYLDFYVGSYHWPAFNLADSAISVGVVLLAVASFRGDRSMTALVGPRRGSEAEWP
jgi:signal peptidase II